MDGKNVDFCWEWWPLAGIKKIGKQYDDMELMLVFPSPRGDKENPQAKLYDDVQWCFRPLVGIKKIVVIKDTKAPKEVSVPSRG